MIQIAVQPKNDLGPNALSIKLFYIMKRHFKKARLTFHSIEKSWLILVIVFRLHNRNMIGSQPCFVLSRNKQASNMERIKKLSEFYMQN